MRICRSTALKPHFLALAAALMALFPTETGARCGLMPELTPLINYVQTIQSTASVPPALSQMTEQVLLRTDVAGMSEKLRLSGQTTHQAAIRHFMAELEPILALANRGDLRGARAAARSERFRPTLNAVRMAQAEICEALEESTAGPRFRPSGQPIPIGGERSGESSTTLTSPYETQTAQNARSVVSIFVAALSLLVIIHYVLIWRESAARRRRLVSIPAILRIGAEERPGRVTVLELQGAKFLPDQHARLPLPEEDLALEIEMNEIRRESVLLVSGNIALHVGFVEALDIDAHRALLAASLTPPRRDPLARDRSHGMPYRYGRAHLTPAQSR